MRWTEAVEVPVPDDAMQPNATLDGLLSQFVRVPDADLRGRYELSEDA